MTDERDLVDKELRRGRGARSNRVGRFETELRETFDDGWESLAELEPFKTEVRLETAKSIIASNDSPDISFEQSINPYRGCEHGCIYCFARPTHCYLGHSAGLDFETKLYAKVNAAELLERELANPRYVPKYIALGAVTDPYQPIEREHRITRSVLEVLDRASHPVGIVTKSALVVRDVDVLARMAERGLVKVAISVTTLDRHGRAQDGAEGRDAAKTHRGHPCADAGRRAGGGDGGSHRPRPQRQRDRADSRNGARCRRHRGRLRPAALPLELKDLIREWLQTEFPDRAQRVINILRSMHGGKDYTPEWGVRARGKGPYAEQIGARFRLATKRLGLNERKSELRTDLFQRPVPTGGQFTLL